MKTFLLSLCSASLLAFATSTVAHADALHGFCYGGATCSDMGSNTPTSTNPPKFGFVSSPSGDTGAFYIDILVPNNVGTLLTGLNVLNTSNSTTSSAGLVSPIAWTSGQLDSYLPLAGGANVGLLLRIELSVHEEAMLKVVDPQFGRFFICYRA